ncbi:MAG: adenylyl-sulfate reductase subunit alpha, partial [Butyrivibrio sp.]|nr:adenylyl-sulfate reductase subunit alpha [Butyrivibrio sp.]
MAGISLKTRTLETDVLIIGGGAAGCYAGIMLGEHSQLSVVVADKADLRRSGCLAAGINALNAYIGEGHTPQDYVDYCMQDAEGIARPDLLLSMAVLLNEVTEDLERRGLTILKDSDGRYVTRGWRNVKINGENLKPILAGHLQAQPADRVRILAHVNMTDLLTETDATGRKIVTGAVGFDLRTPVVYVIHARAVLIATGGAAGLYRPRNPGAQAHRMWYCPFNTGAGLAMGGLAGAELTTLEMRYVALRCKGTVAPVGTIAQGVGARQINSRGEVYENQYGLTTAKRLWGTVEEERAGRGPCFLRTTGISEAQQEELYRAYLNMAPAQTLLWLARGGPAETDVAIEGSDPYIVGGHAAAGFWVDTGRRTTLPGLYAAGDVAGGAPQKYVTGVLAEARIAAESIMRDLADTSGFPRGRSVITAGDGHETGTAPASDAAAPVLVRYRAHLSAESSIYTADGLEQAMQQVMDDNAGGIRTDYRYNTAGLRIAARELERLTGLMSCVSAADMRALLAVYELRERLWLAEALVAHLAERRETRWHGFQEYTDY